MDNQRKFKDQLKRAGLRATPARLAVMQLLSSRAKPMDAHSIHVELVNNAPDLATVYRVLISLASAGIVREVVLQAGTASYEIADLPHHHLLVCEQCGLVEDVTVCCDDPKPVSSSFFEVRSHSLEFMGICQKCA